MRTYIDAKLQIVQMNSNDIVTTSINTPNDRVGNGVQLTPDRRKSIWD